MWPDLSYIIHSLTGLGPDNAFSVVKTFGLFLGLSFVVSAYLTYLELGRKEGDGILSAREERISSFRPLSLNDLLLQSLFYFVIAFKLGYAFAHGAEFTRDPASVVFSLKGNMLAGLIAAALAALYYYPRYAKDRGKAAVYSTILVRPKDRIFDITALAALYGIIGAKLFSVLENLNAFLRDPIGEFFSGSGLTIYGGLLLAFIMVTRYARSKGIPAIHMMDAAAPALMAGYCVGRMGCHFSGDGDWGIVNELAKPTWFFLPDSWWSFSYPHNVLNEGTLIENCTWNYCHQLVPPVFPTPLYEIALAALITGLLWTLRTIVSRAGVLFFIYCLLNGTERFFIEFLRVNPRYSIMGTELSQAQIIALLLIAAGIAGMYIYYRKNIPVRKARS